MKDTRVETANEGMTIIIHPLLQMTIDYNNNIEFVHLR